MAYGVSERLALFTDLYELRMLQAYFEHGMDKTATFSLFVWNLPEQRNYLVACGLDDLLRQLEGFRMSEPDLTYLASLDGFSMRFLDWLSGWRFTGDVFAVQEGTPIFAGEPLLEVVAPITEGQLIETLVMNQIALQTLMASKAARVVTAAEGRPIVDFGGRRAHGTDAAIKGARAFYIAGVTATSDVLSGRRYGIPVAGTIAHSFIEACPSEVEAFRRYAALYPDTILLVDTYDTLNGVREVVRLATELGEDFRVRGVRLDSGDLLQLTVAAREILDAAGLRDVQIFASGGLTEWVIADLVARGAPINAFGVGTDMSVSRDAPALDLAYKLTEYANSGRLKLSTGKRTLPGRKQVFRRERGGQFIGDTIARADEQLAGCPLLRLVMKDGKRCGEQPSLGDIRQYTRDQIRKLPSHICGLEQADANYAVTVSDALQKYGQETEIRIRGRLAHRA